MVWIYLLFGRRDTRTCPGCYCRCGIVNTTQFPSSSIRSQVTSDEILAGHHVKRRNAPKSCSKCQHSKVPHARFGRFILKVIPREWSCCPIRYLAWTIDAGMGWKLRVLMLLQWSPSFVIGKLVLFIMVPGFWLIAMCEYGVHFTSRLVRQPIQPRQRLISSA